MTHELSDPQAKMLYTDYMKEYLCGKAALKYWKIPDIIGNIEPNDAEFSDEYVVFTQKKIYRFEGDRRHTCGFLQAEKYTKDGVCAMPLVFLQVASAYTIYQLIYLGLQVCSGYQGKPPRWTVNEIKECVESLKGHKGWRKAMRALKYITEGSRSPQESYLYMRLRLPFSLGGCGFKGLVFNHKIFMKKEGRYYYADLYLTRHRLIIEYDSYKHHNNKHSFIQDKSRDAVLTSLGYTVIHVVHEQLRNLEQFKILAGNIAKVMKKRIRMRARKFFEGFNEVALLFAQKKKAFSRRELISLHRVPQFPGVIPMYTLYLCDHKRRFPQSA